MPKATISANNRTQFIHLPIEAQFDKSVKSVNVRMVGKEIILSPNENTWESFFHSEDSVSDDFMTEANPDN